MTTRKRVKSPASSDDGERVYYVTPCGQIVVDMNRLRKKPAVQRIYRLAQEIADLSTALAHAKKEAP